MQKQIMETLVRELNAAARAYYSTGKEIMTDKEYDEKYEQLKQLEKETGVQLPDSPIAKVGYEVVSELKKVQHEYQSLSLDKTKDRGVLRDWLKGKEGVLSWKCDGLTIVATYENGKLQMAVTRGNGEIGEDVSHNAPFIKGLPQRINYLGKMIVRGEAIIPYEDFEAINNALPESEERYKNPRNLVSGSVRLLDSEKASKRKMQIKIFNLVYRENMPDTVMEAFAFLHQQGFDIVDHALVSEDTILDAIEDYANRTQTNVFATDGLVLTYNDIAYGASLGNTGKFPRHSMAFKWSDEEVDTVLREIEWSASATGLLNPVAIFDPVEIDGTTVSRASVHNIRIIQNLGLGIGDTVSVYKANMIIPQISACKEKSNNIHIPKNCPVCGGATRREVNEDNTSEFLYCSSEECPAKQLGSFERLVSRDGLNIMGMSSAKLQFLINHCQVYKWSDLFYLSRCRETIINADGFGEKSYQNMIDAIEKARSTTFRQFFYALGIPGCGADVAKILERSFTDTSVTKTDALVALLSHENAHEQLVKMDGIGDTTAEQMITWYQKNSLAYANLLSELTVLDNTIQEKESGSDILKGKTFVITGSLNTYPNRDALKEEIESLGGKVAGSVSNKTSYLINNDITSTSGKNKKAKDLGVPIITEEDYKSLLNA